MTDKEKWVSFDEFFEYVKGMTVDDIKEHEFEYKEIIKAKVLAKKWDEKSVGEFDQYYKKRLDVSKEASEEARKRESQIY
jgi:hypothetical protein